MDDTAGSAMCSVLKKLLPHMGMLALQFSYAVFHVVSRAALNMGISKLVFLVYKNIIAWLFLLPFAYYFQTNERPPNTILLKLFLLALVGITANQGFYLLGLENTSPTLASTIQNSVRAVRFLMAALLGREKVRYEREDGILKVLGTIICCVAGAVITLYKGPVIYSIAPPLHKPTPIFVSMGDAKGKNWTLGCFYLIGHCLSWSGGLVLQDWIFLEYKTWFKSQGWGWDDFKCKAWFSIQYYTYIFGLIQFLFLIIFSFLEKDPKAWIFHSGGENSSLSIMQSMTPYYLGVVSVICPSARLWYCESGACSVDVTLRTVFAAQYEPVQTLVVAIIASIALGGEEFYLGGIIGAVLIIIGLYLYLWGKSKEARS